jgi:hypothetical protein
MGFEHAESSRPIPILADFRGWLDESQQQLALNYLREENRVLK